MLGFEDFARPTEAEPWSVPLLIDALLGRPIEFPWILEPGGERQGRAPTPFAQHLAYSRLIPVEESPLRGAALAELLAPTAGTGGAFVAYYTTGDPLLLILTPLGIIVCGAAYGVAQALQVGLREHLLRLMGVDQPTEPPERE